MSWLLRWFRRPVEVKLQILAIKGEDVQDFTLDHWEGIARLFILVPGLRQVWGRALDEAIDQLSKVPPKPEFEGERIRLAQHVADLKRNLDLPYLAVERINAVREQQAKDLARGEKKPQGVANLIEGA